VSRRSLAGGILLLWAVGLGLLAHRQFGKTDDQRLAEAARQIYPATYYYLVYQGGTPIGSASSQVDTAIGQTREFRITDRFRGKLTLSGKARVMTASSVAYLSRRLSLDSFALEATGGRRPFRLKAVIPKPPAVLLPSLVPIVFMMSGSPKLGRSRSYGIYEPIGDSVAHVTLSVAAESLFTVSDSATYDSTTRRWTSAHADTVRSWSVAPMASSFIVWVDAQGRVVSARGPAGLSLVRTSYEMAFANWHSGH
jgi:hypothetical protein